MTTGVAQMAHCP